MIHPQEEHRQFRAGAAVIICVGTLILVSVVSTWLLRTMGRSPSADAGQNVASSVQGTPMAGAGLVLAASPTADMPAGRTSTPVVEPTATTSVPTTAPTEVVPTPSRTVAPTPALPSTETPTPVQAAASDSDGALAAIRERVTNAEAALRSGVFDATMKIGNDSQSVAVVRFDFGDAAHEPGLHITTTYDEGASATTSDHVTVGAQAWQRRADQQWVASQTHLGAWSPVQVYLPHLSAVTGEITLWDTGAPTLTWYDVALDADVTLVVDASTGTPLLMRRVARATSVVLEVDYREWNTPVQITAPVQ